MRHLIREYCLWKKFENKTREFLLEYSIDSRRFPSGNWLLVGQHRVSFTWLHCNQCQIMLKAEDLRSNKFISGSSNIVVSSAGLSRFQIICFQPTFFLRIIWDSNWWNLVILFESLPADSWGEGEGWTRSKVYHACFFCLL